jgi:hypothetical protein
MQISADFGAAEDKFTGSVSHKFDRGYPVPVRFQMTLFFLPEIFLKSDPFAGNEFDGVAVQLKTVCDVRGGESQNDRIAFIDNSAPGGIPEPSGVDRNMTRSGNLWHQRNTKRNYHRKFETKKNKKKCFFSAHLHWTSVVGEWKFTAGKAATAEVKAVELVYTLEIIFMHFVAKNQNTSTKFQINSKSQCPKQVICIFNVTSLF